MVHKLDETVAELQSALAESRAEVAQLKDDLAEQRGISEHLQPAH
jgi:predicted RNase H-like nuclease (RuvC/YqgF family)